MVSNLFKNFQNTFKHLKHFKHLKTFQNPSNISTVSKSFQTLSNTSKPFQNLPSIKHNTGQLTSLETFHSLHFIPYPWTTQDMLPYACMYLREAREDKDEDKDEGGRGVS